MAIVLLTDPDQRSTLAACRSLVGAGHDVHVASFRAGSLAGASRGVRSHPLREDAMERPEEFAAAVAGLALRLGAEVLLPMTDASAIAVLRGLGGTRPSFRLPMPGLDAFTLASDKAKLLPLAERAGLAVPESTLVPSRAAAGRQTLDHLAPGVLKPHRSIAVVGTGLRRQSVVPFGTPAEGAALLQSLPDEAFPLLVQRRVTGSGVGFFALRWNGALVATFAHRRIREVPPSGGVSVCREAIPMPPALAAAGARLLAALEWEGVAMVECKHDPVSDQYYVIEINPRFWGSLQLAIDAGVDFPRLLVACATGGSPPAVTSYRTGVRSRWGWGELDYVYLRTKLRPPGTGRLSALIMAASEVMRWSWQRDRLEVLRWSDPLPAAIEALGRLGLVR